MAETLEGRAPAGRVEILGVPVSVVDTPSAIAALASWIGERREQRGEARFVCACDVHNVMRAQKDAMHMRALRDADMVLADGMPLVWVSRMRGERGIDRVPGPDFMTAVCERSLSEGWSHYFYGGEEGVADRLAQRLSQRYPGLNVAGTECPPFRPMTQAEIDADITRIKASGADIIWLGLGCPKQERWMLDHHAQFEGRVLVGVGAAFDFHSGRIGRAPRWMRDNGLEWFHRLLLEPRRLWRRYLVMAPQFVALSLVETAGLMGWRLPFQRARV